MASPSRRPLSVPQTPLSIRAADVASGGSLLVFVTNPDVSGGYSNYLWFSNNFPRTDRDEPQPSSTTAGGAGFY